MAYRPEYREAAWSEWNGPAFLYSATSEVEKFCAEMSRRLKIVRDYCLRDGRRGW